MATHTTYLNMAKPELTDLIITSINNYNSDLDIIDTNINNLNTNIATHTTSINTLVSLMASANTNIAYINNNYPHWYRTIRDFTNGTLIETDIYYGPDAINGPPFMLEVKGYSYSATPPVHFISTGYYWSSTIINHATFSYTGTSNSTWFPTTLRVFSYNNKLCFWFNRMGYWQGFDICCENVLENANSFCTPNHVISVTDVTKPTDICMEVDLLSNIYS